MLVGARIPKNHAPENPPRPAPERDERRGSQGQDQQGVGKRVGGSMNPERPIFKHERVWPERKPKVARHRLELREPIRRGRDANVEAGGAATIPTGACDHRRQDYPSERERECTRHRCRQAAAKLPAMKVRS